MKKYKCPCCGYFTFEKKEEHVEEAKEELYEKVSILDLLGDDF